MDIGDPCTVIGPLHSNFYDLFHILETTFKPPMHKFCFLGNYVNRGVWGLETLLLLFAFKLNHPKEVVLLRGPHESRAMCEYFNFK